MKKYNQCQHCENDLDDISLTGSIYIWLNHKEQATLYVCTSQDCKNRGVVTCIPWENKEEN